MIEGVIFDMDGVLVDNADVHIRAFEIFCERYGVTDWREKIARAFGMGNRDIMTMIMPPEVIAAKGFDSLAEEKEAVYREIYAPTIEPVAGLSQLLERLKARDVRCAVGSSGCTANVDFVLEKCGIARFFDLRITGDTVTRCKPDPEIYRTAAARLGLPPERCLVFEDAEAGIGTVVALATTLSREQLARTAADRIIDDYRPLDDAELDRLLGCA